MLLMVALMTIFQAICRPGKFACSKCCTDDRLASRSGLAGFPDLAACLPVVHVYVPCKLVSTAFLLIGAPARDSEKPFSACRDAMEQQQQHNSTSPARLPSDPMSARMFEFEDVDCKASKPIKTQPDAAAVSAADIEDLLLSADTVQSPLPAIKETGEIMAKLVFMYVVLEVAAGLLKGNNPIQHLLLAAIHLKMVFRAMLAPLSMMCSGFVLALVQYSLLLKKQQRSHSSNQAIGQEAAAVAGKSKAE